MIDGLQVSKIYSTLDLKNGFFHVDVEPSSRKYTSFIVPTGQYQFRKVPFGLCNSPAVFQRFINNVFRELMLKNICLVYIDDVVVLGKTIEESLHNLKLTLIVAQQAGLSVKWSKCQFLQTQILFLGYEVCGGTIAPSEEKTKAVKLFPEPLNIKEVQRFLGLTGYFRKFIYNYSLTPHQPFDEGSGVCYR